jgi:hypothetical protein
MRYALALLAVLLASSAQAEDCGALLLDWLHKASAMDASPQSAAAKEAWYLADDKYHTCINKREWGLIVSPPKEPQVAQTK